MRSAFSPAIVYVMLSRATKRANVRVLGELQPHHFVPVSEAGFAAWERREQMAKQRQHLQGQQRQQQQQHCNQAPAPEDQPVLPDDAADGDESDSDEEDERAPRGTQPFPEANQPQQPDTAAEVGAEDSSDEEFEDHAGY